MQQVIATIS